MSKKLYISAAIDTPASLVAKMVASGHTGCRREARPCAMRRAGMVASGIYASGHTGCRHDAHPCGMRREPAGIYPCS